MDNLGYWSTPHNCINFWIFLHQEAKIEKIETIIDPPLKLGVKRPRMIDKYINKIE